MKDKKDKPKYNMWQNSIWMIGLAWREKEKKVLVITLAMACVQILSRLTQILVVPTILEIVERHASITDLIITILLFVLLMILIAAAQEYLSANEPYGKESVRSAIATALNHKAATTSYPNLQDKTFSVLMGKSLETIYNPNAAAYMFWSKLQQLLQSIFGFALFSAFLTTVQPILCVVILLASIISFYVNRYCNNYSRKITQELGTANNQYWYLNDTVHDPKSAKDIRIFGIRTWLETLSEKALDLFTIAYRKRENKYLIARLTDVFLTLLQNGIAYVYLFARVMDGAMDSSVFLLCFSVVGGFGEWISGILSAITSLHRYSIDLSQIRELLEYPEPFKFEDGIPLQTAKQNSYTFTLEHVSYRYPNSDKDILKNIDLTLHPGEKIAVVGLNGAGKTTLIKILCGFLDPTEGRVLLNGRDIREYNRRDYYKLFSAVFQTYSPLAASIAANVAQSEDNIDLVRVKACIQQAGLKERVESESTAYDTPMEKRVYENATTFSGGEQQRLMLARALYKDAPILILDEPTAALDPIAEADVYNRYHEMTTGKAAVFISHRLASTRFCDRILLIADGKIAEEGTHESLLAAGGGYAELFEVQSRYYKEGGVENEI